MRFGDEGIELACAEQVGRQLVAPALRARTNHTPIQVPRLEFVALGQDACAVVENGGYHLELPMAARDSGQPRHFAHPQRRLEKAGPQGLAVASLQVALPTKRLVLIVGHRLHEKRADLRGGAVHLLPGADMLESAALGRHRMRLEHLHLHRLSVDDTELPNQLLRCGADQTPQLRPALGRIRIEQVHGHERVGVSAVEKAQTADLSRLPPRAQHLPNIMQVAIEMAMLVPYLRGGAPAQDLQELVGVLVETRVLLVYHGVDDRRQLSEILSAGISGGNVDGAAGCRHAGMGS
mmetsp:Transcript_94235/g.271514  ORF Transcript_94235/g.271514 Transcript_94235/m.271514 type:complete len:293 (-) Transcript_94235:53-931(-)